MRIQGLGRLYFFIIALFTIQACGGGGGSSESDSEESTLSKPPVAVLNYEHTLTAGFLSYVSGSKSYSSNDEELAFLWEVLEKPDDSQMDISGVKNNSFWGFTPDAVGDFRFKLTVTEKNSNLSDTKSFVISSRNNPPILDHIEDYQPKIHETKTLDLNSSDQDDHSVSFIWNIKSAPEEFSGLREGESKVPTIEFTFDKFGDYEIEIYAYDGFEQSVARTLSFEIVKRQYNLYPLSFKPTQSLFVEKQNSLLLIDQKQPFLYIYNVAKHTLSKVDLPLNPLKMAVSKDETIVAVSTKSSLLQVDLSSGILISEVKTETYGGYPVFYDTNSVVMFAGRRNFNAARYLLRYIKEGTLLPRHIKQYDNGTWGRSFENSIEGGAVAKINPVTNDIYFSETDVSATAFPFTRLQIANDDVSDSFSPVILKEHIGFNFWFSGDGKLLTSGGVLFEPFKRDPSLPVNEQTKILRELPKEQVSGGAYITSASISLKNNQVLITPAKSWREKDLSNVYAYTYDAFSPTEYFELPQINHEGEAYSLDALEVFHTDSDNSHLVLSSYKTDVNNDYETYFIASYMDGDYTEEPFAELQLELGDSERLTINKNINMHVNLKSSYREPATDGELIITEAPPGANVELYKESTGDFSLTTDTQGFYIYKFIPSQPGMLPIYERFLVNSNYSYQTVELGKDIVDVTYQLESNYIYSLDRAGVLTKINRSNLNKQSIELNGRGYKVQLSPDGSLLIVALDNGLYTVDAGNLDVLDSLSTTYGARDITFRSSDEFFLSPDYESTPVGVPDSLLRFNTDLNLMESSPGINSRAHCLYLSHSDDLYCSEYRMEAEQGQLLNRYLSYYRENDYINKYWLSDDESLMVKDLGTIQKFLQSPGVLIKSNEELIKDMTYQTLIGVKNETVAEWAWGADDKFGYRVKGGYHANLEYPLSSTIDVVDNKYFNVVDTIYFDSAPLIAKEEKPYTKFVIPSAEAGVVDSIVCDELSKNCYLVRVKKQQ